MNLNTFNNSRKIIIEHDYSVLMFENKEIILVGQFKNQIIEELEEKYAAWSESTGIETTWIPMVI